MSRIRANFTVQFPLGPGEPERMSPASKLVLGDGRISTEMYGSGFSSFFQDFGTRLSTHVLDQSPFTSPIGWVIEGFLEADTQTPSSVAQFESLKSEITSVRSSILDLTDQINKNTVLLTQFMNSVSDLIKTTTIYNEYNVRYTSLVSDALAPLQTFTNSMNDILQLLRILIVPASSSVPPALITLLVQNMISQLPTVYTRIVLELLPVSSTRLSLMVLYGQVMASREMCGGGLPKWIPSVFVNAVYAQFLYWQGVLLQVTNLLVEAYHVRPPNSPFFSPAFAQLQINRYQNDITRLKDYVINGSYGIVRQLGEAPLDLGAGIAYVLGPTTSTSLTVAGGYGRVWINSGLNNSTLYTWSEARAILTSLQTGAYRGWRLPNFVNGQVEMYEGTTPGISNGDQFAELKQAGFVFNGWLIGQNPQSRGQSFCWCNYPDGMGPAPLDGEPVGYEKDTLYPGSVARLTRYPTAFSTTTPYLVSTYQPPGRYLLYLVQAFPPTPYKSPTYIRPTSSHAFI